MLFSQKYFDCEVENYQRGKNLLHFQELGNYSWFSIFVKIAKFDKFKGFFFVTKGMSLNSDIVI